ncbi:Translation initiation factor 2 subunit gamma [uncultured archaeon]|nr:Translation initiation factor 2 subunit gamma [uncultured archaeon]
MQAQVNIGMVGHVDHGKTSLTKALTGKWTDTHSEELKRGITIKIGYADVTICKHKKTGRFLPLAQVPKEEKADWETVRRVSFLDAPGHETLMTTMISAANIVDGALLVIAANETCPQPQTAEHLMVLDVLGIKNVVVVQNKIDLVDEAKAIENYKQIKAFLKGSSAEKAPIIPISANYNSNLDLLAEAIEKAIPTPKRDETKPAKMYVARSFDINRPGQPIDALNGGVLGGSLICGTLKLGDKIQIKPGAIRKEKEKDGKETYLPLELTVTSLSTADGSLDVAHPGGLIGVGTSIDPALTKGDSLVGNILGIPAGLAAVLDAPEIEYTLIKREGFDNPPLKMSEPLVISVGTATSLGIIVKLKGGACTLKLKRAIYAEKGQKVALSRRMGQRWRLSAFGIVR